MRGLKEQWYRAAYSGINSFTQIVGITASAMQLELFISAPLWLRLALALHAIRKVPVPKQRCRKSEPGPRIELRASA